MATVEFALVVPVLIRLLMGIIEFGYLVEAAQKASWGLSHKTTKNGNLWQIPVFRLD